MSFGVPLAPLSSPIRVFIESPTDSTLSSFSFPSTDISGSISQEPEQHHNFSYPETANQHTHIISNFNMNNPNSFNSVLSMPIPRTRLAPEIFCGDFNKVKEFIQHYERLCTQHNISLDTEKCETIIRYCSKREKETIQNIPSFIARDWNGLRSAILKLYDADLATKRYKVRDVRTFTQKQRVKKVRDLAAWKKYYRGFLRIAGALLAEDKISDREYATYFWQGIPKVLRVRLESKILTRNPGRDLADPFDVDEVDTAAESVLQRDRFDRVLDVGKETMDYQIAL